MVKLQTPTHELVLAYNKQFESRGYDIAYKAITKLFLTFPANKQLDEVLLKVSALNSLYSTNIYAIQDVAKHIWNLDIDPQLEQASMDLVEGIAVVMIKGKKRRNYSFASKYCGFHKPGIYPIYDSYVDWLLWTYRKQSGFGIFSRNELSSYQRYKEIIEQFCVFYGLSECSLTQVDKFLWLYGIESYREIETKKQQ